MTNHDELERAIERAEANLSLSECLQRSKSDDETGGLTFVLNKDLRLILSANREMREALEPFADVGEAVDATDFGQPLFPDDVTAFGCEWSTNGELRRLTWSAFRNARSALTTQRGDGPKNTPANGDSQ
jgi:hypothetical protein